MDHADVAFYQQTILPAIYLQFHTITAFHLKCYVIGGGTMMMVIRSAMMMRHIGSLGNDVGGHTQPGRMIIFIPLADTSHKCHNENAHDHNERQTEHDTKQAKAQSKTHTLLQVLSERSLTKDVRPLPDAILYNDSSYFLRNTLLKYFLISLYYF